MYDLQTCYPEPRRLATPTPIWPYLLDMTFFVNDIIILRYFIDIVVKFPDEDRLLGRAQAGLC